ncbi:MAG TPA: hypothetical protein VFZ61_13810 [Polyangiales bacterium]
MTAAQPIVCNLFDYRAFIVRLRQRVGIGVPASTTEAIEIELGNGRALKMNPDDLYITSVRPGQHAAWATLVKENYNQMNIGDADTLTGGNLRNACREGDLFGSVATARVLFVTAEAARSQVVYQVCQQLLQSGLSIPWIEVAPILRNWGKYTEDHHKRRPMAYGALRLSDYYPEQDARVAGALKALRERGFHLDA